MSEREWYYRLPNGQKGPVTGQTLRDLLDKRKILSDTLVWCEGMSGWRPAAEALGGGDGPITAAPHDTGKTKGRPDNAMEIKKMPWILLVIYGAITLGLYYPFWFLSRRDEINALNSQRKLSKGVLNFFLVMVCINLIMTITAAIMEGMANANNNNDLMLAVAGLNLIGGLSSLAAGITMVLQSFKVKNIIKDHFDGMNRDVAFSKLATFFFTVPYLQYKVNRLL